MTEQELERLDTWLREMRNRWLNRLPHDGAHMDMSGDLSELADIAKAIRQSLAAPRVAAEPTTPTENLRLLRASLDAHFDDIFRGEQAPSAEMVTVPIESIADLIPRWYEGGMVEQQLEEALGQIRRLEALISQKPTASPQEPTK